MNTKTLLIIFAILLLLLTLLSAFGGSMRPGIPEPFVSGHPFEKFYDPSTMVMPEAGKSANPLFQDESSSSMGHQVVSEMNSMQPTAPSMVAQSSEQFIEPFENNDNLAAF